MSHDKTNWNMVNYFLTKGYDLADAEDKADEYDKREKDKKIKEQVAREEELEREEDDEFWANKKKEEAKKQIQPLPIELHIPIICSKSEAINLTIKLLKNKFQPNFAEYADEFTRGKTKGVARFSFMYIPREKALKIIHLLLGPDDHNREFTDSEYLNEGKWTRFVLSVPINKNIL